MSQVDSQSSLPIAAGMQVGSYRIERLIGSGGMSDVYYGVHEELQRPAAIKVLKETLAGDETNLKRFLQEARAAASLVHPNIVQVYDVGRAGSLQYIAQEFVAGVNLRQYLNQPGSSPPDSEAETADSDSSPDRQVGISETVSILLQVLAALSKSAASGIVHRDIKPENIMLTHEGEVKVADFGLARSLLGEDPKLTRAGTTLGTPMYMSPEQIQDGGVDIRSDLYSLGVTLFHMLSGRPPFQGDTPLALAMQHVQASAPDLAEFRPDLPPSLVELVNKLLAKDPDERFRDPSQVVEYLQTNREDDLHPYWPERTVPLPGVETALTDGVVRATLQLQAQLDPKRKTRAALLLKRFAIIAGLLLLGGLGLARNYSRPRVFDPNELPEVFGGVPKQDSAEQQYQFALVTESTSFSRVDKWRAVSHYYPIRDKESNRTWVAMANVQLSRALKRKDEYGEARDVLARMSQDDSLLPIHRTWASLELAVLEDEIVDQDKPDAVRESLEKAFEMFRDLAEDDQQQINELVDEMPGTIYRWWFDKQS